jgi:hypothetical protein
MMEMVFIVHLVATLFMTGVIWFVQLVHYPMFNIVPPDSFPEWEIVHSRRTSWVVVLPMVTELATGCALVWMTAAPTTTVVAWMGLALLAVIWMSTFLLQVPCHRKLMQEHDAAACRRLVQSNWVRTVAWSTRSVLLLTTTIA